MTESWLVVFFCVIINDNRYLACFNVFGLGLARGARGRASKDILIEVRRKLKQAEVGKGKTKEIAKKILNFSPASLLEFTYQSPYMEGEKKERPSTLYVFGRAL